MASEKVAKGGLEVLPGCAVVTLGDVVVQVVTEGGAGCWTLVRNALNKGATTHPSGVIFFAVVMPSAPVPSAAVRTEMQGDLQALGKGLRHVVSVVVGDSLRMSIARTVIRGMLFLSGQSARQAVVASIDEGFEIVAQSASKATPTRTELRMAVLNLFSSLKLPSF